MPARLPRRLLLVLLLSLLATAGCTDRTTRGETALIEDATPVTPDEPLVLALNSRSQVKLANRWFDLYSDQAMIDDYLGRKAQQYRQMHKDYGIPREKKMIRGECVLVFPVEVIIEPELRTKMGSILRLTRMCNDHGFMKVQMRREGDESTVPVRS